jgi:hypothetical protein
VSCIKASYETILAAGMERSAKEDEELEMCLKEVELPGQSIKAGSLRMRLTSSRRGRVGKTTHHGSDEARYGGGKGGFRRGQVRWLDYTAQERAATGGEVGSHTAAHYS